jgi:DegV family protein with EDD domain
MLRIVSDSSTMYSVSEGKERGIGIAPLSVEIDGRVYKEYEEIRTPEFVELIRKGGIPSSSQPSIGEVLELYNQYPEDEILNISMAAGLSGTYDSACMAKKMAENAGRITVLNSRTLCGPHRYLVNKAKALADLGAAKEQVVGKLKELMADSWSFLMPKDFDFLKRGGRLSPLVAEAGKLLRLVPIMTLTEDARQLAAFAKKRSFGKALACIADFLAEKGVDASHKIYVVHADGRELADQAAEMLRERIFQADIEILELSPVFTAQAGPGCVAIQTIRK